MGNVMELTEDNFANEVLASPIPVLVDFWAPWCGPCRQMGPVMDQLASENEGTIKVGKINIDENPQLPIKYGVGGIPVFMVFKAGDVAQRFIGAQPKSRLQEAIDAVKG